MWIFSMLTEVDFEKKHVICGAAVRIFSYKLRYIVGFGLVEMAISTNQKPTIYILYENTDPGD